MAEVEEGGHDVPVFETKIQVKRMGKAIVADLKEALGHLAQVPEPHMTLLYRTRGYSDSEAKQVQEFITQELCGGNSDATFQFTLSPWGGTSDLIYGPLEELAKTVAARFESWGQDGAYRPPHVQLRTRGEGRRRTRA